MFFANAKGRVGIRPRRETWEADFLVFDRGRFGHLEVDGPWHLPATAWEEHERDRRFKVHGRWPVERFAANRCYAEPEAVVAEFLMLLGV